jgi:hypothetical protein
MSLELLEFVVVVSLSDFVGQDLLKQEFIKALTTLFANSLYAEVR